MTLGTCRSSPPAEAGQALATITPSPRPCAPASGRARNRRLHRPRHPGGAVLVHFDKAAPIDADARIAASRPSVQGRRPTATMSLSKVSACSPAPSSKRTRTSPSATSAAVTRAPKRMSKPCPLSAFKASRAMRRSAMGKKSSSASSMTTSEPRRRQTLPSSKPITPAPMTPIALALLELQSTLGIND